MAKRDRGEIVIPYFPRQWAIGFHASLCRWLVLVLHRRAGKTTAVINQHQRAALDNDWEARRLRTLVPSVTEKHLRDLLRARVYGHVMPTYKQAKLVAWDMLKYYAAGIPGARPNETDLAITYPTGARLQLFGADNPDALRGMAFSGLSFDEYGLHPPAIFSEVLSKALADHLGYAIFAGTIKGKNQLYRTYEAAKEAPDWFALWQDIDQSLATEDDAATVMLSQAMHDDQQLITKSLMTQAEYDQEWYLSIDAAIKGAYYTAELTQARQDGRITRVPYDPALPVDTDWDLGVGDSTAIWFSQSLRSGEVRLIDYYEASGEGLQHYARVLKDRGYVYGTHWAPHDIAVREFSSGKSRRDIAATLGIPFQIVPQLPLDDGVNAVRLLLPRCWFDDQKCEAGLEGLTHYRKTYNERLQEFMGTPVHDWSSHGADAFRGLAVRQKPPLRKSERRRQRFEGRPGLSSGGRYSWAN